MTISPTMANWAAGVLPRFADHLWQSTVFALLAGLFALAFRKQHARIRHWVWVAASLKFVAPFWLLVAIGNKVGALVFPAAAPAILPQMAGAIQHLGEPFGAAEFAIAAPSTRPAEVPMYPLVVLAVWLGGSLAVLTMQWIRWRRVRDAVRSATPLHEGREVAALRRLERTAGMVRPTALVSSSASMEPGVFGILRPLFVLPDGMARHLTDAHLEGILAHELCHLRRRDNLTAALHMAVEGLFWFHPLVWWMGGRMVEERERACDEGALAICSNPEVYAESLLKVCEFYVASPVACVAGVTGADLNKRIRAIMARGLRRGLGAGSKALLATVLAVAVAGPVIVGMTRVAPERKVVPAALTQAVPSMAQPAVPAPTRSAPARRTVAQAAPARPQPAAQPAPARLEFEVASIRPADPNGNSWRTGGHNGSFTAEGVPLKMLIQAAFGTNGRWLSDSLISGPAWLDSDRYNIVAKAPEGAKESETMVRLQNLLIDRFRMKIRRESVERPVYALVVGKDGHKLEPADDPAPAVGVVSPGGSGSSSGRSGGGSSGGGGISAGAGPRVSSGGGGPAGASMSGTGDIPGLVLALSRNLDRPVIDKTGLTGRYKWLIRGFRWPSSQESEAPSIFTAIQEQLGLRLEAQRGMIEMLAIDHAERVPTGN